MYNPTQVKSTKPVAPRHIVPPGVNGAHAGGAPPAQQYPESFSSPAGGAGPAAQDSAPSVPVKAPQHFQQPQQFQNQPHAVQPGQHGQSAGGGEGAPGGKQSRIDPSQVRAAHLAPVTHPS